MQRLQAFKYELKPSGEQQRNLCRYAGSGRFVYNKALALQQANHAAGEKFINYVAMAAWLPVWKREQGFAMPNKSSSISATTAFSCPNWVGFATATAARCWVSCKPNKRNSPMPTAISCTKQRPGSAKTTRSYSSKICRYGICPNQRQALAICVREVSL